MSAPPARLWSSSTDAMGVSFAWLSWSPKVISFSFWSATEVSSAFVFDFWAVMASICSTDPDDETWSPQLQNFYNTM